MSYISNDGLLVVDYYPIMSLKFEPRLFYELEAAGIDPRQNHIYIDKIGRVFSTPLEGGRKKAIGVIDPDGKPHITPPAKKTPKVSDRTSVTIYFQNPDYERVARAAAVSGKNLSQFLRDIILEHYQDK